ncbi:MAG: hypothetical protein KC445_19425 [Anaerolineales bacterium]|nr:hypothetical protein [Anaerolineales bacterium]
MVSEIAEKFVHLALLFLFILLPACKNNSLNSTSTTTIEPVEVPVTRIVTREIEKITTVEVTRIVEAIDDSASTLKPIEPIDPNHRYTGTYAISWTDEADCMLLVIHERNLAPFDELSFEIYCNRGGPSYNMGYAADTILMSENVAVWASNSGDCSIIFEFQENGVQINQIGKDFDCGFGGGVYATGVYELLDASLPVLGCLNPIAPCD